MIDLSDYRRSYEQGGLDEADLTPHPIDLFERWLKDAIDSGLPDPNGVVVGTVDADGQPYSRMVLIKGYSRESLTFYTNFGSRKARQLEQNPRVSLLFPWYLLERQVTFLGTARRMSAAESLRYFHSRPRDSQIGAWVSHQSSMISARAALTSKFMELKEKFRSGEIPIPTFWGGFEVTFHSVEFWQGRKNRLHDRFIYERGADGGWAAHRLAP
ncbi:MAG: pyridoxamine 5'-phosphate oxidase [Succinivibrionaceae bacterium]|nr:pyridoxamine 5'-phosphate oxidase [Succinivibrionaceae bacterium]